MKRILLAAALLCAPVVAQGQVLSTESAPFAKATVPSDASWYTQAFMPLNTRLKSLSIWFYGGSILDNQSSDLFNRLKVFGSLRADETGTVNDDIGYLYPPLPIWCETIRLG